MKEIVFTVTLEEANIILASLSDRPFSQVHALIMKLKEQGDKQVDKQIDP